MVNPLLARILSRVIVQPDGCWRWTGAMSQSGWRGCFYPVMFIGGAAKNGGRLWRVNRLVLTFYTLVKRSEETRAEYLQRAIAAYVEYEASHSCDHSYCVNPEHLVWESHPENVTQQARRRARARQAQAAEEAVA